jgi:integrase/recombinase XerD
MTILAPVLEAFFTERLQQQRRASPHTIAAYRDTFRLLLAFAEKRLGKAPSNLLFTDIDEPFVTAFLDHVERARGNSARTRNVRLAALRSLFRFAALREPAQGALIQRVLAIPQKRFDRNLITFLSRAEVDALLAAPDPTTLARIDPGLLVRSDPVSCTEQYGTVSTSGGGVDRSIRGARLSSGCALGCCAG